ncbi:MAG TPA: mobile mystery protein B [Flavobacteriales bacterium]|nr:mobile mystery protein B [Flavobacteriales bacterium]HRE95932.1 mobile mystery protein B [Flavobacteriales bacterium]HRJ38255.1 mobile mystery protein B [Flavobacteriales bacterium]
MGLNLEYIEGQTPLEDEEKDGLLIPSIATRGELDEFEQQNIEKAIEWTLSRSFKPEVVFSVAFIQQLQKRMYGDVWKRAGHFRTSDKNLGIDKRKIPSALKMLVDDAMFWHENKTYLPDELAIRFKHRLVCIHCFPNGNGRHSRLIADVIIEKIYKQAVFTWGAANLYNSNDARKTYLKAVKAADKGDYRLLMDFARK